MLEQILGLAGRVLDQRRAGGRQLADIVRRNIGGHSHRDAGAAVHQELRQARRQHDRLLAGAVVGGPEGDGLAGELVEQIGGERLRAALGVAVGGGRVAVERAEVPVAVDQHVAQREVLRHAHQRLVDRRVAVRVVAAHDGAHDLRALGVLRLVVQAQVVPHPVEDAALHRLQAVAHVGERARGDHAERVVEIAAPRLLVERDGLRVAPAAAARRRTSAPSSAAASAAAAAAHSARSDRAGGAARRRAARRGERALGRARSGRARARGSRAAARSRRGRGAGCRRSRRCGSARAPAARGARVLLLPARGVEDAHLFSHARDTSTISPALSIGGFGL